jgi:hypothetical protein
VGSRSRARARAQVSEAAQAAEPEAAQHPRSLIGAAVVQGVEAAGIGVAAVLAGVDAAGGRSYHVNSGVALTLIGLVTAVVLGYVALGIARGRKWSRTPALLTQLFCGIVSIYLLQGHRYVWGGPGLVLALAGFATLLVPASIKTLSSGPSAPPPDQAGRSAPGQDPKASPKTGPKARPRP